MAPGMMRGVELSCCLLSEQPSGNLKYNPGTLMTIGLDYLQGKVWSAALKFHDHQDSGISICCSVARHANDRHTSGGILHQLAPSPLRK